MSSLVILFASTSGHTEYVIDHLVGYLKKSGPKVSVIKKRIEQATPEDLVSGDVLLLASGTWNTGGIEGQLNPHMHAFVHGPAKNADLQKKNVAIIALGDQRYRYTARAGEHLENFVQTHGGQLMGPTLKIINEPYGQEKKIDEWADAFMVRLRSP